MRSSSRKKSRSSKLGELLKSIDKFGEGVSFEIEGRATKTSYLGSLLSITLIVITLSYAWTRFEVMRSYGDTAH